MSFGEVYDRVLREYPDILTVEEISQALGISTKTGYRLLRENKIEHLKVGRSYRIPKAHLLAYLRLDVKIASRP
ncbi:DNA-binding protein [Colidextribacter sp. OB.20]|uniref:helix-turn-helix domain-containing protein n=1 Tax=Colidextribacter sp. OB.20 TaxID=2304568 RepID=UPI00136DB495|nr:helix-turn-helix domain-containing protein [Colidextribacter sp. OB.20]NBI11504.1 DNA-binding protein [Colidextribacter sp. OB.20]